MFVLFTFFYFFSDDLLFVILVFTFYIVCTMCTMSK